MPLAWLFGLHEDKGLVGVWWGLCVGYTVMTFLMVSVVVKSDWGALSKEAQKRSEIEEGESKEIERDSGDSKL